MQTTDPTPTDEITATLERPAVAEVAVLEPVVLVLEPDPQPAAFASAEHTHAIPAEELQPIPAAPSAEDDLPADDLAELRA